MKVISTIQKRAYLLVAIIAFCIVAFLLQDISLNLNNIGTGSNYIGKVNGETLDYETFKKEYDEQEAQYKIQKGGQGLTEEEANDLRGQIWNQFLNENIVGKAHKDLGIAVSEKEILEITRGENIDPGFKQIPAFTNKMGLFDPLMLENFLKTLNQDEPGTPPGTRRKQWETYATSVLKDRKNKKLDAIIEHGLYVPKWMSDYDIKLFGANSDIKYVAVPYSTVDVEKIEYDDSELEEYFEENKYKYCALTPTVQIALASFDLKPSQNDSIEILDKMNARIEEMRNATNDTSFFRAYGDKGGYNTMYYTMADFGQHPKMTEMYAASKRSIVGPYIDKDYVKAFKILDKKNIADSVLIKTITISFQDVKTQEAQIERFKLIDSIFRMVDTLDMNFDQVAAQYSADRGQSPPIKISRSDKSWNPEIFFHGATRKHFKSTSEKEGAIKIIKVLNFPATTQAVQLGEISMPYVPSTETQQKTFNIAMKYIQKCKTAKEMEDVANSDSTIKFNITYVNKEQPMLEGIEGNAKEAIRWAFKSKSGDISSMMQVGNNYVYCGNLGSRSRDDITLENIKEDMLDAFKNYKAYKIISEKMSGKTLKEVANSNKVSVDTFSNLSFSNSAIMKMPEPSVVTAAYELKPNQVSKPIKGSYGVFKVMTVKNNPSAITPADELSTKTQLNQSFKKVRGFMEAFINKHDIDDNRINIF